MPKVPDTVPLRMARRWLASGQARRYGEAYLETPDACYQWNHHARHFERLAALPDRPTARPVLAPPPAPPGLRLTDWFNLFVFFGLFGGHRR
jgi:hypothetical protein